MKYFNDQLQELREQVAKKKHLDSVLKSLYNQQREIQDKIRALNWVRADENADVQKLEKLSLESVFYMLTGKREEKLEKERQEAYAAQLKCKVAEEELEAIVEEIKKTRALVNELTGCEQKFSKLKQEKKEMIKQSAGPEAEEIMEMEEELAALDGQMNEIREAYTIGSEALRLAEQIIAALDKAQGWGTWDTFARGGLISDAIKHSNINAAERMVGDLQLKLRKYETELADVKIEANVNVSVGRFMTFADYWLDGIFFDWMVLNRIKESKSQAESVCSKIRMMQFKLDDLRRSIERKRGQIKANMDARILEIEG